MVELRNCPFCGNDDAELRTVEAYPYRRIAVFCCCCEATGPSAQAQDRAAELWNSRAA
jgi:Lar family restriction alleviation protein